MATVDVVKLGLALPLGYLAAKLAPNDPASATTAATVASSLIGGAAGNFAHQALDAPTSALFARVFKAGTGLDENHTILLALRGAYLDALAEVAERAAKRLDGGDRDAGFQSYRAGLDGYLGAARQKITPAGFAVPSAAERAVLEGLPEAFSAGLAERGAGDADARDLRAGVEAAVLAELRADLREDAPASFAAAFRGSDAPGDDGWFGAFVRAASARLNDNAAFATIWTASRLAEIEAALTRHEAQLRDIAERMATEDAAERRHRELLAKQDEILEQVSRDKGVDPEHLHPILERLGHQDVPLLDIPRVLAGAVDQLQAMAREQSAPSNDGADIDAAISRARALLAGADAVGAVAELDRALDEDEVFQAAVKRRVRLLTEKVEIQRATYDHGGALATLAEIVRLDPDQTWAHGALGDIYVTVGRLGSAKVHFEAAFAAAERLRDVRNLSVSQERIGNYRRAAGDRNGALEAYRNSLASAEILVAHDPGNPKLQHELSISYNKIGDCLSEAGNRDGALASYRAGLAVREALAAADPDNPEWQRDLAVSQSKIGDCLRDAGERDSALAAYRICLSIAETLAARDPGDTRAERDLSVSHNKVGDCMREAGDHDGALAAHRASLAIREALAARDPGNAIWQRDLSLSHGMIGDCMCDAGDYDGALAAYRTSLAIVGILAAYDPGNAQWQNDVSLAHDKIGNCLRYTNDCSGALAAYRTGLEIRQALAARNIANTGWQRDLFVSLTNIGDCLADAGDRDGALTAYRDGLAIVEGLAERDPGNANWQRDLVVSNVKLSQADPANAAGYLATALEIAQQLSATGRLAPIDAWMPAELERRLVDAQAAPPLSRRLPNLLIILDVGEAQHRPALFLVVERERRGREIHRVAVEVAGHGRRVAAGEFVELRRLLGRHPAADREARDLEVDFEVVLVLQPLLQHVELQRAHDADDGLRAVIGLEHLHDALLGHLLQRFLQLLRLHGVADADAAQDFRREGRHAAENQILALGQRVADAQACRGWGCRRCRRRRPRRRWSGPGRRRIAARSGRSACRCAPASPACRASACRSRRA